MHVWAGVITRAARNKQLMARTLHTCAALSPPTQVATELRMALSRDRGMPVQQRMQR